MYEAFKKIYEKLNQDQKNEITETTTENQLRQKLKQKNFRKALQAKLWKIANILNESPFKKFEIDLSETDGDETHPEIRTRKGRPKKEEYMKTDDVDAIKNMLKKARSRQNKKKLSKIRFFFPE